MAPLKVIVFFCKSSIAAVLLAGFCVLKNKWCLLSRDPGWGRRLSDFLCSWRRCCSSWHAPAGPSLGCWNSPISAKCPQNLCPWGAVAIVRRFCPASRKAVGARASARSFRILGSSLSAKSMLLIQLWANFALSLVVFRRFRKCFWNCILWPV